MAKQQSKDTVLDKVLVFLFCVIVIGIIASCVITIASFFGSGQPSGREITFRGTDVQIRYDQKAGTCTSTIVVQPVEGSTNYHTLYANVPMKDCDKLAELRRDTLQRYLGEFVRTAATQSWDDYHVHLFAGLQLQVVVRVRRATAVNELPRTRDRACLAI